MKKVLGYCLGVVLMLIALIYAQDYSFEYIRYEHIQSRNFSESVINGSNNSSNQIPTGTILLYETSEGRLGKLKIEEYGQNLKLKWVTYDDHGWIYSEGDSLVIRPSWSCDLDLGIETSEDSSDFFWHHVNSVERDLRPRNGAGFLIIDTYLSIKYCEGFLGSNINIPINVGYGFDNVAMCELHVAYDTTFLQYTGMNSDYLSSGDVNETDGIINIVYIYSGTPFEVPEYTSLVDFEFIVDPEAMIPAVTDIYFTGSNIIADPDENAYNVIYLSAEFSPLPLPTVDLTIPEDITLCEDQLLQVDIVYSNFRGGAITVETLDLPDYLELNENMTAFTGIPTNVHVGEKTFQVTAYDNYHGDSAFASINFEIQNAPSEIFSTPVEIVYQDHFYEYDVNSDDEGYGLQYGLDGPDFLNIDSLTGLISGMPASEDIGHHEISIIADDQNGSIDTQEFLLYVLYYEPGNEAPVVDVFPNINFPEDNSIIAFDLDTLVADPDTPDSLLQWFISFNGVNNGVSLQDMLGMQTMLSENSTGIDIQIDKTTRVVEMSGKKDWFGIQEVVFLVTDGDNLAMSYCNVNVTPVNDPPVIEPIETITFLEDTISTTFQLAKLVTDVDDNIDSLSYFFTGNSSVIVHKDPGNIFYFSAAGNWNGQEDLLLQVQDKAGAKSTEPFALVVVPVNDPPQSFSLISPIDGDTCKSLECTWEEAIDIDKNDEVLYKLLVSSSADFNDIDYSLETSETNIELLELQSGIYYWKVIARDLNGAETITEYESFYIVTTGIVQLPTEFNLLQNYPNPFNPTTTILYQLPKSTHVKLSIYDITGKLVETLVNEYKNAGYYSIEWNAENSSSGIYLYRIDAGEFSNVRKCLIVK